MSCYAEMTTNPERRKEEHKKSYQWNREFLGFDSSEAVKV